MTTVRVETRTRGNMSAILETILERQREAVVPTEQVTAPVRNDIALCLSGGGYRAALFHLGVMRCLHDMGILQTVRTVSSVSGGSIISAFIAKRLVEEKIMDGMNFSDWEAQVSSKFRSFVLNDIRTVPFFAHVLWNWIAPKWRARHLQRKYSKKLLTINDGTVRRELKLIDLPEKPYFVFCSTDLTFGVNWIFTREKVGDYRVGYADAGDWPLAAAVTASSCFPPIFGPMVLSLVADEFKGGSYEKDDRAAMLSRINLTDGGVYDNLGLEPVDRGYQTLIASDGGSPFGFVGKGNALSRLMRYTTVIMNQVASLRKRVFFTGIKKGWYDGLYIGIGYERTFPRPGAEFDGYVDPSVRKLISGIRTDLDMFNDSEARILENHGYHETHNRVMRSLPTLVKNPNYKPATPHPEWEDESKLSTALSSSHRRFSPTRLLRAFRSLRM